MDEQNLMQVVRLDPRVTYANLISAGVTVIGGIFVAGMLYQQQQELQKALSDQKVAVKEAVAAQRLVDEKQEASSRERYDALQSSINELTKRVDRVLERR